MYLYAFCWEVELDPVPQGIRGPLGVIRVAGMQAVVETGVDLVDLQTDEAQLIAAVVRHDQVICELFRQTTVLPLRFGTQFATAAALRSHLQTHAPHYLAQLQTLQGKVEIHLTLTPTTLELPPIETNLKGSAYFLAKKQRLQVQADTQQAQQAQLHQLHQTIVKTFVTSYIDPAQADRAYLLLTAAAACQLSETLQTWHSQCPLWVISASQPLPPYHFVN